MSKWNRYCTGCVFKCMFKVVLLIKAFEQIGQGYARDKWCFKCWLNTALLLKSFLHILHLRSSSGTSKWVRVCKSTSPTLSNSLKHTRQLNFTAWRIPIWLPVKGFGIGIILLASLVMLHVKLSFFPWEELMWFL